MPTVERGEGIERPVLDRLASESDAALRRRPAHEDRLAGAIRVLAPHSPTVRSLAATVAATLARRRAFDRPLFVAALRALAEHRDARASAPLKLALATDDGGGLPCLSSAAFLDDAALTAGLVRLASGRHPHIAFAAETARVARRESAGTALAALAPKDQGGLPISLAIDVFLPLTRGPALSASVDPALAVLRDAERHLGRWLVLGEVGARAGADRPLVDALERTRSGPPSARAAWSLVAWALRPSATPPKTRPGVDLITRLSDRPSASRDMAFLFRLADARAEAVRPLLESLARDIPLKDELAVRAALYLARDHGRGDLADALREAARAKRDPLRGLSAAALFDAGVRDDAVASARDGIAAKSVVTASWSALVLAAAAEKVPGPLVTESSFRRLRSGWLE